MERSCHFKKIGLKAGLGQWEITCIKHTSLKKIFLMPSAKIALEGLDTLGRFSFILYKGDNFCDFLFVFLHTNPANTQCGYNLGYNVVTMLLQRSDVVTILMQRCVFLHTKPLSKSLYS